MSAAAMGPHPPVPSAAAPHPARRNPQAEAPAMSART